MVVSMLASVVCIFLNIMGITISWHKTIFSMKIDWVGYNVHLTKHVVSIPVAKRLVIAMLIRTVITKNSVMLVFVETFTGKLAWASAPFLGAAAFLKN